MVFNLSVSIDMGEEVVEYPYGEGPDFEGFRIDLNRCCDDCSCGPQLALGTCCKCESYTCYDNCSSVCEHCKKIFCEDHVDSYEKHEEKCPFQKKNFMTQSIKGQNAKRKVSDTENNIIDEKTMSPQRKKLKHADKDDDSNSSDDDKVKDKENDNFDYRKYVVGYMDRGFGFHYPDMEYACSGISHSSGYSYSGLLLITGVDLLKILHFFGLNTHLFTVIDNIDDKSLLVKINTSLNGMDMMIENSPNACIVSCTENTKPRIGTWHSFFYKIFAQYMAETANRIWEYLKGVKIFLVVNTVPFKILRFEDHKNRDLSPEELEKHEEMKKQSKEVKQDKKNDENKEIKQDKIKSDDNADGKGEDVKQDQKD